ncbi:MAG TPA: DUF4173 domain-containing protein, partial [Bacteroidia bacterium]|nr:DUF4173 domain-containing protein [Bacteroidia bacterium]
VVVAGFHSGLVFFTSVGFMIIDGIERRSVSRQNQAPGGTSSKRFILLLIVFLVALVFFFMYRESSMLFLALTENINLDWISGPWCAFVLFGSIVMYGFYYQSRFAAIGKWEAGLPMNLETSERTTLLDRMMSIESEYFSGLALLGLLNVLLLLVNCLDVAFMINGSSFLPQDITYSQYVHQGTGMLIMSIICAMLIMLFYFRNYHSDSKQFRQLRTLAYIWVAQNIFMLVVTMIRNHEYIHVYGLTYKRIGVDVYLLLACIGLGVTMWKVYKQRTNAFLVRTMSLIFYAVLIIACPVNWDRIIFNHNTAISHKLDMDYLNDLSASILPDQLEYVKAGFQMDDKVAYHLQRKTYGLMYSQRFKEEHGMWPSLVISDNIVYNQLRSSGRLDNRHDLSIERLGLETIYFFEGFLHVNTIYASYNCLVSLGEIGQYTNLRYLSINNNNWYGNTGVPLSLSGLEKCTQLETLVLNETYVSDWSVIGKLPNLKELRANTISIEWYDKLKLLHPQLKINE